MLTLRSLPLAEGLLQSLSGVAEEPLQPLGEADQLPRAQVEGGQRPAVAVGNRREAPGPLPGLPSAARRRAGSP